MFYYSEECKLAFWPHFNYVNDDDDDDDDDDVLLC